MSVPGIAVPAVTVIAVDVSSKSDLLVDESCTPIPSPWKIIYSRLNPFVKTLNPPSILSVMGRASLLGSIYRHIEMVIFLMCEMPERQLSYSVESQVETKVFSFSLESSEVSALSFLGLRLLVSFLVLSSGNRRMCVMLLIPTSFIGFLI